jgi:hypothetical protein
MKKLLEDPAFAAWKEAKFPELPPDISRELACTMRIKSAEELLADSLAADTLLPIDLEFPAPDSTNTFF